LKTRPDCFFAEKQYRSAPFAVLGVINKVPVGLVVIHDEWASSVCFVVTCWSAFIFNGCKGQKLNCEMSPGELANDHKTVWTRLDFFLQLAASVWYVDESDIRQTLDPLLL
jgi:hypothetical protein